MTSSQRFYKHFFLLFFCVFYSFGQANAIRGIVTDKDTGEPVFLANVTVKNKLVGAATDFDGFYAIANVPNDGSGTVTLVVYCVGYKSVEIPNVKIGGEADIVMEEELYGETVVVTASRKGESILEAAATIEKMDAIAIKNAPAANFYDAITSMKAVDMTSSSMNMKVINMRGFNSTSPDRIVQYVDGMDNQAPALNFPVGNMVGMSELDIANVEIVYGAASALYGANAFNGVISMTSKSPWEFPGLSARFKTGSRNLLDGSVRYAQSFDNKFAFKVNLSYMQADDWVADGTNNQYGAFTHTSNESTIAAGASIKTQATIDQLVAAGANVNTHPLHVDYLTAVGTKQAIDGLAPYLKANGLELGKAKFDVTNTYAEKDIVDYNSKNLKLNTGFYYRLTDELELSYIFNYGSGTGVYQGSNRYSLKNLSMQQHKLEFKGTDFTIKAFRTVDDAGESYDSRLTSIHLNAAAVRDYLPNYYGKYFEGFFGTVMALSGSMNGTLSQAQLDAARQAGYTNAATIGNPTYLPVGSTQFEAAFKAITGETDPTKGAKFFDESAINHFEGYKSFEMMGINTIAGASYRQYDPNSKGTIFDDADKDITTSEYGVFSQFDKKILDERLKVIVALRYDKHENFDGQLSPRVSFVYSLSSDKERKNNGNLRFSYQTAFRNPSLQDQYIKLNVGPYILLGNIDGKTYPASTILDKNFNPIVSRGLGGSHTIAAVKPEQVKTWEIGYKSIFSEALFVDLNYYRSNYTDFLQAQGLIDHTTNQVYLIDSNTDEEVTAEGFSISANYYLNDKLSLNGNYAYAKLVEFDDTFQNTFNTPENKYNIGLSGRNMFGGFGFSLSYKHVDGFNWVGDGFTGPVPEYNLVDAALLYDFRWAGQNLGIKLAVSNLLDKKHIEAAGAPKVGRLAILQLSTEL